MTDVSTVVSQMSVISDAIAEPTPPLLLCTEFKCSVYNDIRQKKPNISLWFT